MSLRVLAIAAHPDDLEILCAGTLARMVARGDEVVMAHATDGSRGGGPTVDPVELVGRRAAEAARAAALAGARHVGLGIPDSEVSAADPEHHRAIVELVRECAPNLVLTHHPEDYHRDHREVSRLVFAASFAAVNPLVTGDGDAVGRVPALYYMDTLAGLGFQPAEYVDVTEWIDTKLAMLREHESQIEYLRDIFGVDILDEVEACTRFRGLQCGVTYAEGFVPCLTWHRPRPARLLP